ncbi:DUF2934 domain-containing protein [Stutzerimonas stutzeri]|uniref:DUF2934 domain-containing protein n=1 Tax=Stutzerimonas stutzeri TaxID=316 RepID=UPI00210D4EFD|nr:DUF2934 domain-containing protein [Stutzerimonas stutzeri]MCQ4318741.1 DUF2934 domain-containing protein [Stutzerimonas stutzeri]
MKTPKTQKAPKTPKTPDTAITAPPQAGATGCCGDRRQSMIADAAYYRAERRGFCGNADDALNDWLQAEAEIERVPAAPPESSSPGDDSPTR